MDRMNPGTGLRPPPNATHVRVLKPIPNFPPKVGEDVWVSNSTQLDKWVAAGYVALT
jgi:hypothetical protein